MALSKKDREVIRKGVKRRGANVRFGREAAAIRKRESIQSLKVGGSLLGASLVGTIAAKAIKIPKHKAGLAATSVLLGAFGGTEVASGATLLATQKKAKSKEGLNIPGFLGLTLGTTLAGWVVGSKVPGAFGRGLDKAFRGATKAARAGARFTKARRAAKVAKAASSSRPVKGALLSKGGKKFKFVRIKGRVVPIRIGIGHGKK